MTGKQPEVPQNLGEVMVVNDYKAIVQDMLYSGYSLNNLRELAKEAQEEIMEEGGT